MYFLIYDHSLTDTKYQRPLAQLETFLTDRGIGFKTAKLTLLKSVTDLVDFGIRQGAHTIVAVGGDRLVGSVVNALAPHSDISLGVVPLGEESRVATFLGVPVGREAHEILSARKIEHLDLGTINEHYFFILSAEVQDQTSVTLEFDERWSVSPLHHMHLVGIYNFNDHVPRDMQKTNPQDGWLNTIIVPTRESHIPLWKRTTDFHWGTETDIPTRRVRITTPMPTSVIADGARIFKTPLTISLTKHRIRVIVGRDRLF